MMERLRLDLANLVNIPKPQELHVKSQQITGLWGILELLVEIRLKHIP